MSPDESRTPQSRRGAAAYRRWLVLARGVLVWERLWPALWPPIGILGLLLAVALFDLLPRLANWLHLAILLGFAAAFGVALWRALAALRLPGVAAGRRRLERDSGFAHRPLATLDDRLAEGQKDPAAAQLWALHRRRLLFDTRRLRLRWPRAGWAAVDGFALRALVGLLLVVAAGAAGADWPQRLARAALPSFAAAPDLPPRIQAWLNPPIYTGQPPRFLDIAEAEAPIAVPYASRVLAQVEGIAAPPRLRVDGEVLRFEAAGDGAFKASREIVQGATLAIERDDGGRLAAWPIDVVPDAPPEVAFLAPPGASRRGALALSYRAADDYAVEDLRAVIRRVDRPDAEPLTLDLVLPARRPSEVEGESYNDLTPHPWAGIPVTVEVEAVDALEQRGRTEAVELVLPERSFNHPVARALIEQRKRLTLDPEQWRDVAAELAAIGARPAQYFNDVVVGLGIAVAERRLVHDRSAAAVGEVQQLLWDLALRLEEGELATAERDLRELQRELMEALANDAPQEEIDRLMDALKQAMDRFLQALAEQAMQEGGEPPDAAQPFELPEDSRLLQSGDLQRLLDQARELSRAGQRDAARELLAQLQRMLENLQAFPFSQQMNQQMREAQQMMRGLEGLMRDQQRLLDETFRRAQQGQRGEGPARRGDGRRPDEGQRRGEGERGERGADGAAAQEALRRRLGELMRQFGNLTGDIPRPLGNAEQSMRAARDALGEGQFGDAVQPQADALDQLQQGLEAMLQNLQQQLGQGRGGTGEQFGSPRERGRDPFGRETGDGGFANGEEVQIPSQMELRRAREILDELRRRSGQSQRPQLELDYIDRLLRQF